MDTGSGGRADSGSAGAAGKPEESQALTEEALHIKRIQVCLGTCHQESILTRLERVRRNAMLQSDWYAVPAAGNTGEEQAQSAQISRAPKGDFSGRPTPLQMVLPALHNTQRWVACQDESARRRFQLSVVCRPKSQRLRIRSRSFKTRQMPLSAATRIW